MSNDETTEYEMSCSEYFKRLPPKKRTRRGLAAPKDQNIKQEKDVAGIPIYTSQINDFVKQKKELLDKTSEHSVNNVSDCSDIKDLCDSHFISELKSNQVEEAQAPISPPNETDDIVEANGKCLELLQYGFKKCTSFKKHSYTSQRKLESYKAKYNLDLDKTTPEILDDDFEESVTLDKNRKFSLKVRCRSNIRKFTMKMSQPFHTIINELASSLKVQPEQVLLVFKDSIIKPGDTPYKLEITVSDIVGNVNCELIRRSLFGSSNNGRSSNNGGASVLPDCNIARLNKADEAKTLPEDKENLITLKLQSKDMKKKIPLSIYKADTMSILVEKFAEERKLPVDKISLQFDGDVLDLTSTPEELDLEDGYCIDVIVRS